MQGGPEAHDILSNESTINLDTIHRHRVQP